MVHLSYLLLWCYSVLLGFGSLRFDDFFDDFFDKIFDEIYYIFFWEFFFTNFSDEFFRRIFPMNFFRRSFPTNFPHEFFRRIFPTYFPDEFSRRIFWLIFPTNFSDEFFVSTYFLTTFRIGEPSILFFTSFFRAVNIADNICTKQGNVGLKSAVYNQEQFQTKIGL